MNNHLKTDIWIYYLAIVLGLITVVSALSTLILTIMGQPVSEVLIVLGLLGVAGLVRLLISPLK
jgi:hypothetical protein